MCKDNDHNGFLWAVVVNTLIIYRRNILYGKDCYH